MTDFYRQSSKKQIEALEKMAIKALENWGMACRAISLIKYRENAVFRVDTTAGKSFALRIHRAGYHTDAELRSELQWINALAHDGIDVPEVIPTDAGEFFTMVAVPEVPDSRQVDLFAWVEGRPLGSVEGGLDDNIETIRQNYRTIGQMAAKIHNQATQWTLPSGFTRHAWDIEGLVGENPFWGRFWELEVLSTDQRRLLLEARERVREDLEQFGSNPENYSMIHADFVPENLIVDGDQVKLIDFDDAGFGWHLFEIATALYFIHQEPYFDVAKTTLIEGYREFRDIPDDAVNELPLFMLARGFTYLGWVHTRSETKTAREFTPALVDMAYGLARKYLGPS